MRSTDTSLIIFAVLIRAYETLSNASLRRSYDRGEYDPENPPSGSTTSSAASPPPRSSSSRFYRDPFDDPFFHNSSFATSFGRSNGPTMATGQDPFSLFDRMFADFHGNFGRGSSNARSTSSNATAWDPFGTGFGTFGFDSQRGGRSSFLDSFFGDGPSSFNGFPDASSGGGRYTQHPSQSVTSLDPRSGSNGRGVQQRQNQGGFTNCSFSTSFGSSSRSSSSASGESTSTSTRIVNGKREDVYKKVDSRGNSTVHVKSSDGKESVFVNGVQQDQHPLLSNGSGNGEDSRRALPASSGKGSRAEPFEIC